MSLTGPRAACSILHFASGFHIPTKQLEMPRLLPQLFEDPLPRGGGWWVVTVMFWEHVPGSRLPALRISHSAGFGDLKNANRVILWRLYAKAVDPLVSILETLTFFIRHITKTQMGWQQIKGGRILRPWHSQCLSCLYSHNADNILLDSKTRFLAKKTISLMHSLNVLPFLFNSSYRKQFWLYTFASKVKAHLLLEINGEPS